MWNGFVVITFHASLRGVGWRFRNFQLYKEKSITRSINCVSRIGISDGYTPQHVGTVCKCFAACLVQGGGFWRNKRTKNHTLSVSNFIYIFPRFPLMFLANGELLLLLIWRDDYVPMKPLHFQVYIITVGVHHQFEMKENRKDL